MNNLKSFDTYYFFMIIVTIIVIFSTFIYLPVLSNELRSAPYYMPFDDDAQDIDDIIAHSGLRHLILAFVLATDQGECIPTWNGKLDRRVSNDTKIVKLIEKIRKHNGDVSVSFGGYDGVELGHACKTAEQLAEAYQIVIDKYKLTYLDFDIEGDDLGVPCEESRRFDAIKILKNNAKKKGKKLHVSLTLPTTIVGINDAGREEIKRAISAHAEIDLYTLMAFDFGGSGNNMVKTVINVMEFFHKQIKSIYTNWTDLQVYSHSGMILMNGHTDQPSELYTQDTFKDLIEYASSHGLSRVSFWSINRDRQCLPNRPHGWAAPFCSCVPQNPYDFSKILSTFDHDRKHVTETQSPSTLTTRKHEPTTLMMKTSTSPSPIDDVDCNKVHEKDKTFPYKNDRHKFIICVNGEKFILSCPKNTVFDPKLLICVWENV